MNSFPVDNQKNGGVEDNESLMKNQCQPGLGVVNIISDAENFAEFEDDKSLSDSISETQTIGNEEYEPAPHERNLSRHFDKILPVVKEHKQAFYSVFTVEDNVFSTPNIYLSPEFAQGGLTWSTILYPYGINKSKPGHLDVAFQIKSYELHNPKRFVVYTISLLSKGVEYLKRETAPFFLGPRGQQEDGFRICIEDFGERQLLSNLQEYGCIKFRVVMEIKLELTLLEQTKRFFGWVHIKWALCRGNSEEWQRALSLLDEDHRRVAEAFRVLSAITSLQTANLQRQTEYFGELINYLAEMNALCPENVDDVDVSETGEGRV